MEERIQPFAPPVKRDFTEEGVEQWLNRLRDSGDPGLQALDALKRLVATGCERQFILFLFMDLHISLCRHPVSRMEVQRTLELTKRLETSVSVLAKSQLHEELGLDNDALDDRPGWSLQGQLTAFREQLEHVVHHASERENVQFNFMMREIVIYVRRTTGRFQDDELSVIVKALKGPTFSSVVWRKGHLSKMRFPHVPRHKKQVHRVPPRSKDSP